MANPPSIRPRPIQTASPTRRSRSRRISWLTCLLIVCAATAFGDEAPQAPHGQFTIQDADRAHWAFQPVARPATPTTRDTTWPRDELDRFILARLETEELRPAPAASRRTLMRRLSFDLTGLPPTPQDLQSVLGSEDDQALAKYVDKLIASDQFGEHWARHWLDQVRYRPFPKKTERDDSYRQWVARAFNEDMPYDRFLRMQIAGDLLPPPKPDEVHLDGLVAVRPWSLKSRHHDQVDLFGRTFLGMSLICARCHDHKHEPLGRSDYYAIKGIFESGHVIDAPYIRERKRFDEYMAGFTRMKENEARMKKELKAYASVSRLVDLRARIETERRKLDDPKQSKDKVQATIDKLVADEKKTLDGIKKRKIALDAPEAQEYMRLREENNAFTEKWRNQYQFDVFVDYDDPKMIVDSTPPKLGVKVKPGEDAPTDPPVPRRFPVILAGADQKPLGEQTRQSGRLELANWIGDAKHPITARLMVNRVWYHLMGEGLTPSLSNFGRSGQPPSHPLLLDYLADEFVKQGWSVKRLVRRIVLSSTYQQASRLDVPRDERDRRLSLFAIARPKRLEVESIWRTLNRLEYAPDYAGQRRDPAHDMMEEMRLLFDGADSALIVPRRTASVSQLQALFLMNSGHVKTSTERIATRLHQLPDNAARIGQAYRLLYGREATADEVETGESFLATWKVRQSDDANQKRRKPDEPTPDELARWQAYLQVLLLSNEFLFVD